MAEVTLLLFIRFIFSGKWIDIYSLSASLKNVCAKYVHVYQKVDKIPGGESPPQASW